MVWRKPADCGFQKINRREGSGRKKLSTMSNLLGNEVRGKLKNIIGYKDIEITGQLRRRSFAGEWSCSRSEKAKQGKRGKATETTSVGTTFLKTQTTKERRQKGQWEEGGNKLYIVKMGKAWANWNTSDGSFQLRKEELREGERRG